MFNIDDDIRKASTLPSLFYRDEAIFRKVIKKVFSNSWQYITDLSSLNEDKMAYPFTYEESIVKEPLFLINNKNKVQCFSNVCTHRGNILIDKAKVVKNRIVCSYHGKSFDQCGKFISMPMSDGMLNFPSENDNLTEIKVKSWNNLLFTTLSSDIKFEEVFTEIDKRVSWMPIKDFVYRDDLSKEYFVDVNWALYCDNYLEGFHIPFVHNDLNDALEFENYDVNIFKYCNLQIGIGKDQSECFDLPNDHIDHGKKIAAYYFWVFPNLMLNFYPWGLSLNKVIPLSQNKTKIIFQSFVWDENKLNRGAGADLDKVEMEDQQIIKKVQKGMFSQYYKSGRFSPKMEKGVHHFHLLISKFCNE